MPPPFYVMSMIVITKEKEGYASIQSWMHKKEADWCQSASRFLAGLDYSPGSIAPIGHASAHVPQSMHTLGSIT